MALHNSSQENPYDDQDPQRAKPRDSSAGLVVLLLAALALVVAISVPSVRSQIGKIFRESPPSEKVEMGLRVWAKKREGSYYCADSRYYGHGSGSYMSQGNALTLGYQPSLGNYCKERDSAHSKMVNKSDRGAAR